MSFIILIQKIRNFKMYIFPWRAKWYGLTGFKFINTRRSIFCSKLLCFKLTYVTRTQVLLRVSLGLKYQTVCMTSDYRSSKQTVKLPYEFNLCARLASPFILKYLRESNITTLIYNISIYIYIHNLRKVKDNFISYYS
jgi:hypothetical protein